MSRSFKMSSGGIWGTMTHGQRRYFWEQSLSCTSQIPHRPPLSSGKPLLHMLRGEWAWGTTARIRLIYVLAWHSAAVVEAWAAGAVPHGPCAGLRPGSLSRLIQGALAAGRETAGCNWSAKEWNGSGLPLLSWAVCRLPTPALSFLTLPSLSLHSILGVDAVLFRNVLGRPSRNWLPWLGLQNTHPDSNPFARDLCRKRWSGTF